MMTSVLSCTNTSTSPPVPAGTIAALATIVPVGLFSVETVGICCGGGQIVRKPSRLPAGLGTTVTLNEYATGAWVRPVKQGLSAYTGRRRVSMAWNVGGPSGGGICEPE